MNTTTTVTVQIERDFDGKWAARWPADVVAAGHSAGAGRHDTQRDLAAALDARGWRITGRDGRTWTLERIDPRLTEIAERRPDVIASLPGTSRR